MLHRSDSRTRTGRTCARAVFPGTITRIKKEKLHGASSLVPGGVVVEEGQRGAPASEGVMVAFGAKQVDLRNQADQSAHVIGGNLVTA